MDPKDKVIEVVRKGYNNEYGADLMAFLEELLAVFEDYEESLENNEQN